MKLHQAFTGKIALPLDGSPQRWVVKVNGPGEIICQVDGVPLWVANNNMKETLSFAGGETFEIIGQKGKTYGVQIAGKAMQVGEPINDDEAYRAPPTLNYLAKLRERARQHMGINRENFLDGDTPFPGYEVPEELDPLWEEEAVENARKGAAEPPAPPVPDGGSDASGQGDNAGGEG